ncbi:MAG: hypothetical protein A3C84_03650 [Candidatus Ryanbacteria bacterium RIFCSPHIGHO2_02_FULL_48_12]|uniref:Uncharacterized protein n=1 Tax=Candidatus Ryanbacteria bacterium RIFCSPHIGHO2_01_FULL_48_27 TaxID=1802115 RepID=A0A1G2G6H9_9BACT|nr:MAG: hypothetical protein A2756_03020 [Candidatus Ryanbacteria bacterium RIFCSPHIGHO2_01_FULL_48_27]OGZ49435.1 MAG: hypothetical protein A3C84_03650 [Candidatus Ryanbacteria bacterium RIFCSPHIGHO2_02_FULL_48_12]
MSQAKKHIILLTEEGTQNLDKAGIHLKCVTSRELLTREEIANMLFRIGFAVAQSVAGSDGYYTITKDTLKAFLLPAQNPDNTSL